MSRSGDDGGAAALLKAVGAGEKALGAVHPNEVWLSVALGRLKDAEARLSWALAIVRGGHLRGYPEAGAVEWSLREAREALQRMTVVGGAEDGGQ
jgi:hypothetical protein